MLIKSIKNELDRHRYTVKPTASDYLEIVLLGLIDICLLIAGCLIAAHLHF